MGIVDRRRHQLRRLAAGVAEHDALVAGALVLVAGGVDALGDVGRLRVQSTSIFGVLPVEAVLLVADVLDRDAGDVGDVISGDRGRARGPRRRSRRGWWSPGSRRRRAPGSGPSRAAKRCEEGIHHLIGDAVADLVRMALGNGFAGEQIARA